MSDINPSTKELTNGDFTEALNPFVLFGEWLEDAKASELNDPNAFSLSTVDPEGLPNVRVLLLKDFDENGFVFYTNYESAKGRELLSAGKAAMCFHWKSLRRQVRLRGEVAPVEASEADAYYQSRPRESRIGAWASQQSRPLSERAELEKAVADFTEKFEGGEVPRPPYWSGFRLVPSYIEFWHDRPFRLHDRMTFTRQTSDQDWTKQRLFP